MTTFNRRRLRPQASWAHLRASQCASGLRTEVLLTALCRWNEFDRLGLFRRHRFSHLSVVRQAQNASSATGGPLNPVTISLNPSNNNWNATWLSYGFGISAPSSTNAIPNDGNNNTVIFDTGTGEFSYVHP